MDIVKVLYRRIRRALALIVHFFLAIIFRRQQSIAEWKPRLAKLANHPVMVKVRDLELVLGVSSNIELFRFRTYASKEPETLDWIEKNFASSDVVYDVGANIGLYTLYAARFAKCKVFAFEPESQNFGRLMANIVHNKLCDKVISYSLAVSDESKLDVLHVGSMDAGHALHNFGSPNTQYHGDNYKAPILQGSMSITVDELWMKWGLPQPTHIKVDVDGLEEQIIRGALKTLSNPKCKTILVEINTEPGKEAQHPIVQMITSCGMKQVGKFRRPSSTPTLEIANYIFGR